MNRTDFLKTLGFGVALIGTGQFVASCQSGGLMSGMDGMNTPSPTVSTGSFTTPLSIPETLTNPTTLTAKARRVTVGGRTITALGYRDGLLGPTIRVQNGQSLAIQLQNELAEHTNIHWHGLLIPALMDGHPDQMVKSQGTFDYQFRINQQAGTNWYHPHVHGTTGKQVTGGLSGLFIVESPEEKALNLPAGSFEIPLILQDKRITAGGIEYNPTMMERMNGYFGETMLVNGTEGAFLNVATRYYRFRVLNGSSARMYNLSLSNGKAFAVIGSDNGLLPKPASVTELLIGPGERVDLLIDFSGQAIGSEVFLVSNAFSGMGSGNGRQAFNLLRFAINRQESDSFRLPAVLTQAPARPAAAKTRTFALTMAMSMNGGMHRINGKVYKADAIEETVTLGTTEIWEFDNSTDTMPHLMHFHGTQYQVLERTGGRGKLMPHETGWKDTVLVAGGERVKVLTTFTIPGKFVLHCHILEHEDDGMMINFRVA